MTRKVRRRFRWNIDTCLTSLNLNILSCFTEFDTVFGLKCVSSLLKTGLPQSVAPRPRCRPTLGRARNGIPLPLQLPSRSAIGRPTRKRRLHDFRICEVTVTVPLTQRMMQQIPILSLVLKLTSIFQSWTIFEWAETSICFYKLWCTQMNSGVESLRPNFGR